MTTNNWHVPLNKFSDEQRKVIERVYGSMQININRYFGFYNGLVLFVDVKESLGKEITADEAFKILGLDRLLEPHGLQNVDWGKAPDGAAKIVQSNNGIYWLNSSGDFWGNAYGGWINYSQTDDEVLIATRPKPKKPPLTPEQVEAVREVVSYVKSKGNVPRFDVDKWLKEREQTGGEL